MGPISENKQQVLIALFLNRNLSANSLTKEIGAKHYQTGMRRAEPLIEEGLVKKEEVGEKGNYRIEYSLTDQGYEVAEDVVELRRDQLEERVEELTRALKKYREGSTR